MPISTELHSEIDLVAPLLKWAGGKRNLASFILPFVRGCNGRYFEPFAGGAAILFALRPQKATLADVNHELIGCYKMIRDYPLRLAAALARMPNNEENYYRVRASEPTTQIHQAARFIYLTSLSFNGIYRQNLRGEFNVPYGQKHRKSLPGPDEMWRVSQVLHGVELLNCDFQHSTQGAMSGDVVYFDLPYTVAHNNNGFVKYNASIFSWQDQMRLAAHATDLAARGCRVVVSNADHPSVRDLYPRFTQHTIQRRSVIAASSVYRRVVTECLFVAGLA